MRRSMIAGAVALAAVLCVALTTPAHAKAQSFLDGMIKAFSADKNNVILDLRRCKDNSYDIIYFKKAEGKVVMLKVKGSDSVVQTPLRTYDIEMIKSLTGDLSKALKVFSNSEPPRKTNPQLWAATYEPKDGKPVFMVHCSTPMGEKYRRSFAISATTWNHVKIAEAITLDTDPLSVPWSEEEKAAGNNDFPAEFKGKGAVGSAPAVDSTGAAASDTEAKTDTAAEAGKSDSKTGSDEAVTSQPNGGNGQGPRGRRNRANRNRQNQDAAE